MSNERKSATQKTRNPFEDKGLAAMAEKMTSQQGSGCACMEMMFKEGGAGCGQMMAKCAKAMAIGGVVALLAVIAVIVLILAA